MKYLILAAVILSGSSAYASKARLQALGQGDDGSYYIMDTRNIFLNPAFMHTTVDFANFEWGQTTRPSTPNAEGGFIHSTAGMKYGIQLGRESNMASNVFYANNLTAGNTPAGFLTPQDTVELLVAGEGGMRWGASLLYQRSKVDDDGPTEQESSGYEIRGGMLQDNLALHGRANLFNKSKNATSATVTEELSGNLGLLVGGTLELGEGRKLYGELNWEDYEVTSNDDGAGDFDYDVATKEFTFGFANVMARENDTTFFYAIAFDYYSREAKDSVADVKEKEENVTLPLTIGLETAANDWLVLRGSVRQNVLISKIKEGQNKKENAPNTTTVAAGAGVKFRDLILDGTFEGSNSSGELNSTEFLANVGMTYTF